MMRVLLMIAVLATTLWMSDMRARATPCHAMSSVTAHEQGSMHMEQTKRDDHPATAPMHCAMNCAVIIAVAPHVGEAVVVLRESVSFPAVAPLVDDPVAIDLPPPKI
ncbi:hypothetical protein [Sphingobium subterraneum]|uniref:DUF2946 domain-containing protein n=1 Tax=Sphingobium subterraneum TaxID=627688 RepID=A0A841IWV8_9SPHN|nr:hypothetical protein [Sphingobium subterraneum]MBB6123429.1 hypothetical protein [Sphingobium subterraneum]